MWKIMSGTVIFMTLMAVMSHCGGKKQRGGEERFKIKTPDGKVLAIFSMRKKKVKTKYFADGKEQVLEGKDTQKAFRSYVLKGQGAVKVKATGKGFKIKSYDGKLLWKVKITDDKIKISNNEENKNPYVISIKKRFKIKVKRNNVELGKVSYKEKKGKLKVKTISGETLYSCKVRKFSAMPGVLLMRDIPSAEQYIIMAELLSRGL